MSKPSPTTPRTIFSRSARPARMAMLLLLVASLLVVMPGEALAGPATRAAGDVAAGAQAFYRAHPAAAQTKKKKKKKVTKKKPKKKTCVVKKRNKKGKLVTVYRTKAKYVPLKRHGKIVRHKGKPVVHLIHVFVYRYTYKKVRVHGHVVRRRIRHKIPRRGPCKRHTAASSGAPVTITVRDPSAATLDFGAFTRTIPLTGTMKGFIVGGLKLGQENQIQISRGQIDLAPTGIFIDDVCNGQVSDAIRTGASFAEIDPGSTGNTVTMDAAGGLTGLLHMRVQVALQLRNDDNGCGLPYLPTGWTDFTIPFFVKGKLDGLTSTLSIGETLLDELSACLAVGDSALPCNGFSIPFPAIFSAKIVGDVDLSG